MLLYFICNPLVPVQLVQVVRLLWSISQRTTMDDNAFFQNNDSIAKIGFRSVRKALCEGGIRSLSWIFWFIIIPKYLTPLTTTRVDPQGPRHSVRIPPFLATATAEMQTHFGRLIAEKEGFEPSRDLTPYLLSKKAQSASLTLFRISLRKRSKKSIPEKSKCSKIC